MEGAIETANTTGEYESDTNAKLSIKEIVGEKNNYGQGVYLDTNFFDKVSPRKWGEKLRKHVYENLAGTELTVYNDGKAETIYLAKKNDRVLKSGANNSHKVIDKLARYRTRDNIRSIFVVHIDELAEVLKYADSNTEHTHQWMDENGWEFRTAYAMDKTGKIYEMTLNIARGKDRNILYDINKIKEIDHGDVASKGLAHKNQSLKNNVSQKTEKSTHEMKLSLAGVDALTADNDARIKAYQLEQDGKSELEIFKETGWFRGADGKWRFEIDDSEAKIYRKGDAELSKNEEYIEWEDLMEDYLYGLIDEDDPGKLERLEELNKKMVTLRENKKKKQARDYLEHSKLFEAYPFIANIPLNEVELEGTTRGQYLE